jgi:hypothetical protein
MTRHVSVLVLLGCSAAMSLAGGCAEVISLHAATVSDTDLPAEPLALAVETSLAFPGAASRMHAKPFASEYQFSWGRSDRGSAGVPVGDRCERIEKSLERCLDKSFDGARERAFERPAPPEGEGAGAYRLRVVVRYAYVFVDYSQHRELGKRNWAGCELEYRAELLAPGGRALAAHTHIAGAHRFGLFAGFLAEECLGQASRQAAVDVVRWAHPVLAQQTVGETGRAASGRR